MGVLACFRNGCENIMCHRYSNIYGYICGDYFEELVNSGINTNVKEFMSSYKESDLGDMREVAEFRFNKLFPVSE